MDEELKYLIKTLIEGQTRTDQSVSNLAAVVASHVDLSEARAERLEDAHVRFVDASNERMSRIEEMHIRTEQAIAEFTASGQERMKQIEANA